MGSGSNTLTGKIGSIDRSMVEQIVRQVALEYLGKGKTEAAPVLTTQASSRHMHVCREDMDVLFGPGSELTFDRPLFQEGNFAAKETVTIVGPRSRLISNLRILGPMRKQSQVELAFTDAIMLGFSGYSHPAFRRHRGHAGRGDHRAQRSGRNEGRRDSRGDSRAHEPGEAAYFGVSQRRPHEVAHWRRGRCDI